MLFLGTFFGRIFSEVFFQIGNLTETGYFDTNLDLFQEKNIALKIEHINLTQ
jgi:hypothetical protein